MRILLTLLVYCCSIKVFGCIELKLSVDDLMDDQEIVTVFRGKVIESTNNIEHQLNTNILVKSILQVDEMWKGEFTSKTVTIYQSTPCFRNFKVGKEYLVFAYSYNDSLQTDEN